MGKKNEAFVALPAAVAGKVAGMMVLPEDVRVLFVDWALEQYASWCTRVGKKVSISRAEVAFPGPYMRLVASGRSFYFAWDGDRGRGIEITKGQYPRAAARSQTMTVMPTGEASGIIGAVRRLLVGDRPGVERN